MECLVIREFFDKTNNNMLIKPGKIYKCSKERYNFLLSKGVVEKISKDLDAEDDNDKKCHKNKKVNQDGNN